MPALMFARWRQRLDVERDEERKPRLEHVHACHDRRVLLLDPARQQPPADQAAKGAGQEHD
jgi:hypothetical protein